MRIVPLAACIALLASLTPSTSEACSPAPCMEPARTAPPEGASVPATAPAVALFPLGIPQAYDGGLELLSSDGGVVPTTIEQQGVARLLRPASPLVAGETYRIAFGPSCDRSFEPVDAGTRFEVPFTAAPDLPLPTDPGQIEVVQLGEEDVFFDSCSGVGGHLAFARFALNPSEQMLPWLPVTAWILRVDGNVWATLSHGMLRADGTIAPSNFFSQRTVRRVFAQCPGSPSGGDTGVRPGTHVARLEAHVLGTEGAIVASAGVPFTLTCTSDGGTVIGDGTTPLQPDLPDDVAPGCGCGGGVPSLLAASVLLLTVVRRRRRG